jgi:hypothetical protein
MMRIRKSEEILEEYFYPIFNYEQKSEREALKQFKKIELNIRELNKSSKPYKNLESEFEESNRAYILKFRKDLEKLEEIISKGSYEEMHEYPTEIKELIQIGERLHILKMSILKEYTRRIRNELLIKVVKTLQKYLNNGGKLKKEDARNYVEWIVECMEENPKLLMELDLSPLLSSFGYTKDEIFEINALIDQYIIQNFKIKVKREPTKELREYLRNEILLICFLVGLSPNENDS